MTALSWAIILSVLSAICYAAAAVAQEHFAAARRGILRWALPLLLTGTGAGLHVIALQYGTVGVVQALGALTLIFALPMAAARTRRVTRAAWLYSCLTVGGLAGLLALSTGGPDTLSAASAQWTSAITGTAVAALAVAARRVTSPMAKSLLLAGAAGVAFAMASLLTKTVMSDLAAGISGASVLSVATIVGLAAAGQVLGQRAYRGGGLAAPLAMVSVTNPAVAGVIGILLLGDGVRLGGAGAALALGAAVVTARGVIGLAAHPPVGDVATAVTSTQVSEMTQGAAQVPEPAHAHFSFRAGEKRRRRVADGAGHLQALGCQRTRRKTTTATTMTAAATAIAGTR